MSKNLEVWIFTHDCVSFTTRPTRVRSRTVSEFIIYSEIFFSTLHLNAKEVSLKVICDHFHVIASLHSSWSFDEENQKIIIYKIVMHDANQKHWRETYQKLIATQ